MKRPNILLVILDATRHDICSCYGCERLTTPALDRMAEEGVLYEQAISPAPWTLPAVTSIFTGLYPGQTDIYIRRKLDRVFPTIARVLTQNGYAAFGISNNDWLSADFGLQQGFTTMHKLWQWLQTPDDITNLSVTENTPDSSLIAAAARRILRGNVLKNALNTVYYRVWRRRSDYGASRTLRPLARWIESQQVPWFAFVHYMEAHLPYKPPWSWVRRFTHDLERAKWLLQADQWRLTWRHIAGLEPLSKPNMDTWRDFYLAEVAYTDYHLGLLLDWLRHTGRLDDTLVVVTADHGENLGEHGLLSHTYCIYDTLLRVPLVIRYPPLFPAGRRVSHQVQTLDLFATMLEVAGIDGPPSASLSLLPQHNRRPFTVAEYGVPRPPHAGDLARYDLRREDLTRLERGLTALRTDTHKLILGTDETVQLYARQDDPGEEHNVADRHPELVEELRKCLEDWWREHGISGLVGRPADDAEASPEVEARLRALGYLE